MSVSTSDPPPPIARVLVTGASSGIGLATTRLLAARGWTVFAGVRRAEDAERLADGWRVVPVWLDVRDEASVFEAVRTVTACAQAAAEASTDEPSCCRGPFSVVSNAGVAVAGPLEDLPVEAVAHAIDVNALGMLRVVRAALPVVRATGGRIVNVGSMSGRVALPYVGPYAASKFALRALTDALRVELAPWGIPVSLVEPGNVRTPIWGKTTAAVGALRRDAADSHADDDGVGPARPDLHGAAMRAVESAYEQIAGRAMDAAVVAAAIERVLLADRPPAHHIVGRDARAIIALDRWLPTSWRDATIRRRLGLGPGAHRT